jgi:hypothetical protein
VQPVLYGKTVCIIGCGAVGSQVAVRLALAGVGGLLLVDPQVLEAANVGRHALGISAVGRLKASLLAQEIARRVSHMRTVEWLSRSWATLESSEIDRIAGSDLIVSAIGDWSAEGPINDWHIQRGAAPPIVYAWLEEHGTAGHALAVTSNQGCLHCVLQSDGRAIAPETLWPQGGMLRSEPACGTMFQPFGPVELGYSEALVADLCLDVLLGKVSQNTHRVYATSSGRLAALGGSWTPSHGEIRPAGFDSPLMAPRSFIQRSDCPVCSGR